MARRYVLWYGVTLVRRGGNKVDRWMGWDTCSGGYTLEKEGGLAHTHLSIYPPTYLLAYLGCGLHRNTPRANSHFL